MIILSCLLSRPINAEKRPAKTRTHSSVNRLCASVRVRLELAGPHLHLPSVYIVLCSMRRDHSFVKQHEGGGNGVCVCVLCVHACEATGGQLDIETNVADRLMTVVNILVMNILV